RSGIRRATNFGQSDLLHRGSWCGWCGCDDLRNQEREEAHQQSNSVVPSLPSWSVFLCENLPEPAMKTHTEYLTFHTDNHREFVHITPQVESIVYKSGVDDGIVLVSAMHITAGVYVNDLEDGLIEDIDQWLEKLAPYRRDYKHHRTGEDNGDSHLKAILVHHQVILPITKGKLDLGTWQRIFYAEFDGQRNKRVLVKVLGE